MKKALGLLLLLFISARSFAQDKWQLKKESDGMKIYTASKPNSNVRALKVEYSVEATLTQLAALLLDIKNQPDWVYSTKTSSVLKKIGDNELVYYTEKSMPWPATNRDVVTRLKITQQEGTHVMTVSSIGVPDYIPKKDGLIRVPSSKIIWTVTPVDHTHLKIDYVAEADPGGSIPAFIVNMFVTKGPYETFKKLKAMADLPAYKNAHLDFIKD